MRDFVYHAPTEVVFGKQSEEKVAGLVKKYGGHKVLVHYGGKSAQKSGLLDKICGLLRDGGVDFVCLGGVVPNPRLPAASRMTAKSGTSTWARPLRSATSRSPACSPSRPRAAR